MRNKVMALLILQMLLINACQTEPDIFGTRASHNFYVRNDKVDLPVLVEGNTSSKTFIVYVHGGPETGAIAESADPIFWGKLEERYAMVYYDQRGIGMSNGNFDESTLSIEQYVDDLDKIITVLNNKYGSDIGIFLLGGSWGGYVGTAYITTKDHQTRLKGWIEIGGAHNMELIQRELPKHIKRVAQQQISRGTAVSEWQKHLDFATTYDTADLSFDNWLKIIQQYSPITEQLESDGELSIRKTDVKLPVGVNWMTVWANDNLNKTGIKLLKKYYNSSLTPKLSQVTIPCRFFWGKYDFASAPALAYDAYDNIGTPYRDKQLKIFEKAEHSILLSQPDELLNEIYAFVDTYK